MRILDRAIDRVRRGVKDTAASGAGADNKLGHALAWLGSELRGDAIPERLRDAAGRLASLLHPVADPAPRVREAAPVVALEDALAAKLAAAAHELPKDAAHAGNLHAGVCPFTGMRADGTLALPPGAAAAPVSKVAPPEVTPPAQETAAKVPSARAKPRQKNKERLAGEQAVEKTSARSATRPAPKQPRSRTQASRKKA